MKNNIDEAVKKFKEIIELEKDNSSGSKYSFKSYEKLCLIDVKKKMYEEFANNFEKMFIIYDKIDDVDKQDTIRSICNEVNKQII